MTSPSADDLETFSQLAREGRYTILAKDDADGFVTVRAGGVTRTLPRLTWWREQHGTAPRPIWRSPPHQKRRGGQAVTNLDPL